MSVPSPHEIADVLDRAADELLDRGVCVGLRNDHHVCTIAAIALAEGWVDDDLIHGYSSPATFYLGRWLMLMGLVPARYAGAPCAKRLDPTKRVDCSQAVYVFSDMAAMEALKTFEDATGHVADTVRSCAKFVREVASPGGTPT